MYWVLMHCVLVSDPVMPLTLLGNRNWPPSEAVLCVTACVLMSNPGGWFSWLSAVASLRRLILGAIERLIMLACAAYSLGVNWEQSAVISEADHDWTAAGQAFRRLTHVTSKTTMFCLCLLTWQDTYSQLSATVQTSVVNQQLTVRLNCTTMRSYELSLTGSTILRTDMWLLCQLPSRYA
jgi:hypothetical protein